MTIQIRRARTGDVPAMQELLRPFIERRILLGKELVTLYEAIQEFQIAETADGEIVGFGAIHVFWEDLGEIRTLAVADAWRQRGVGHLLLEALEAQARALGLSRLFCLTFEVEFFERHGFQVIADPGERIVDAETYYELVRSPDEGVAEFLDLARVKQNTLGNSRLLKHLD